MLICYVGAMFASKTTSMINKINEFEEKGRKCIILSPAKDTRRPEGFIRTHDGKTKEAITVNSLDEIIELTKGKEIIAFDEIQFFADGIIEIIDSLLDQNKVVLVSGLDTDYNKIPFGVTMKLCAIADKVIKCKGRCKICRRPSRFSYRKVKSFERVLLGSGEEYLPVCRGCYNRLKRKE